MGTEPDNVDVRITKIKLKLVLLILNVTMSPE